MKKKTAAEGYTIIERKQAGEVMIVVGHHPTAPSPYVTWKAYDFTDFSSFHYGHYFNTRQEAMADFYKRLAEAWEHYTPARTLTKRKHPQKKDKKKPSEPVR